MSMPTVEPLFKNDKPHFHTNGGSLAVGYKLYTYFAGTNSPVAMYSDPSGTTIYENPIVLNSRGEPDGQGIYADIMHTYKIILKDTMDNVVWSMDDVSPMGVGEIHIESGIENIVADTANVNVTISQDGKTAHIGVDDVKPEVFYVTPGITTRQEIRDAVTNGMVPIVKGDNGLFVFFAFPANVQPEGSGIVTTWEFSTPLKYDGTFIVYRLDTDGNWSTTPMVATVNEDD